MLYSLIIASHEDYIGFVGLVSTPTPKGGLGWQRETGKTLRTDDIGIKVKIKIIHN
jgi:hypothetical protein